jgi:hypothetical protein
MNFLELVPMSYGLFTSSLTVAASTIKLFMTVIYGFS